MENTALFPVFYLPPISWFVHFCNHDGTVILDQHENFNKQTYRNRTCIFGANGKLSLMIPINHKSQKQMNQILVSDAEKWRIQHWKSIKTAYQGSPYFEFYEDQFRKIFESEEKSLFRFNLFALEILLKILKSEIKIELSSEYQPSFQGLDFRDQFSPKKEEPEIYKEYYQTFSDKLGFIQNLSILDLICNLGPESLNYLRQQYKSLQNHH